MRKTLLRVLAALIALSMFPYTAGATGFLETYKEMLKGFFRMNLLISEDYIWDFEGENLMCTVEWEMLTLDEASAKAYPELAAALEEINRQKNDYMAETAAEMAVLSREIYADTERTESCSTNLNYYIQRADQKVLSFRSDSDIYWGGAHPDYGTVGVNLDVQTGEELSLSDVVYDTYVLITLLARKMEAKYTDLPIEDMESTLLSLDQEMLEWTLGYEGITFYFNPYVILPYASGKTTATIRYDEAKELFNPAYLPSEQSAYAIQLPSYEAIDCDLNLTDGKSDVLEIYPYMGEYDSYEQLDVVINGEAHSFVMYAYRFDVYQVVVDTGETQKCFLYIETTQTDDYTTLIVIDLNGAKPELVDELSGSGFEGSPYAGKKVFVNPKNFTLETRVDIIGTHFGTQEYSIDEHSGMPIPQDDYFELDSYGYPMTSLIDLTVTMLDNGEEKRLPAGTEFCEIRTDGESYMDFLLNDGRECRVRVDTSDYPGRINGIDEYECFDGFGYAG